MRVRHESHLDSTILDTASLLALLLRGVQADPAGGRPPAPTATSAPVGAWRSADGTVRLEIRTDGTYDGKVAGRKRAAHGTYQLDGATMTLRDDSGLRTPVTLYDGGMEMAGHRFSPAT